MTAHTGATGPQPSDGNAPSDGTARTDRIARLDRDYTVTTNRWGRITMLMSLVLATAVPFYLLLFADVDLTVGNILTGFLAVAAVYGAFWIVEPLTYYPILGPAGMYQAFMIGNISNKLLPSAIVAQSAIGAKPGTRKAEFAATAAICGAAVVHVVSLALLVGILGNWIVSITPEAVTEVARIYILPSILGGIAVQLVSTLKQVRATIIALVIAAIVVFGAVQLFPWLGGFTTAVVVLLTIVVTWFARPASMRGSGRGPGDDSAGDDAVGIA